MADNSPTGSLTEKVANTVNQALNRSQQSDVQSYAKQVALCSRMHENLNELDRAVHQQIQTFEQAIVQLRLADYLAEEMPALGMILRRTAEKAEALSNHIRVRHKAYITHQAQQIVNIAGPLLKK
jgi:ABC-type transporter Mla subunit MlaD